MNRLIVTVLALTFALSSAALAAPDGEKKRKGDGERKRPSAEAFFKRIDKNNDGKITKDEFGTRAKTDQQKERAAKAFAKIDADNSGDISLEEFKTAMEKRREAGKGRPGKGKPGKGKGKKPTDDS